MDLVCTAGDGGLSAISTSPSTYLFPSGQLPVSYYGDADFSDATASEFLSEDSDFRDAASFGGTSHALTRHDMTRRCSAASRSLTLRVSRRR
jgi:hypothetical protein